MSSFVYQRKKHLEKEKRKYESTLCTQYNGNPLGSLRLSQDNTINCRNTRIACQTRYPYCQHKEILFTVQIGTITQNVNYQNSQYEHCNHLF